MDFKQVSEICAAILVSLGGGGAVVFGLSGFLGKIWADRALEQDRNHYNQLLQEAKSNLDKAVNRYQVELDTLSLAHKLRTTEEFSHLRQLWKHMAILAADFETAGGMGLRFLPADPNEQKRTLEAQRRSFFDSLASAQNFFIEEKLFVPSVIAECADSVLSVARLEAGIYLSFADQPDPAIKREYTKELAQRLGDCKSGMEQLEKLMRQHIDGKRPAEVSAPTDAVR
jgi:hypothetical protein